jgi:hypothetical protein
MVAGTAAAQGVVLGVGGTNGSQPAGPGGTVTGHVTCGDSQRPARFAQVMLFGVPAEVSAAPKMDDSTDPAQMAAAIKAATSSMASMKMASAMTGIDGAFTATNVAPGDYYVFGVIPGYVAPMAQVQALYQAGADPKKPLPGIPMVHVAAEHTASADVTVERGGAISGRVVWDDGTPVARAMVTAVSPKDKKKDLPSQFGMLAMGSALSGGMFLGIADDLGHYRISGLAPGDYEVKATLQTQQQFGMQGGRMNMNGLMAVSPLVVYAPAAFHDTDAAVVTVRGADEAVDRDITFNLNGLHTVSGHVSSMEDHHALNSGRVRLQDAKDKDFSRQAALDANGNYSVTFVPAGTYNLTVSGAGDTEPAKDQGKGGMIAFSSEHTVRSYEKAEQTVVVADSDLIGQDIELKPSKTTAKDMDFDGIVSGESYSVVAVPK